MGWTGKQSCPHCAWQGVTRHQYYAAAVLFSYLAVLGFVVVTEVDLPRGNTVGLWIGVIASNLWVYGLPRWLLRRNACRSCGQRFEIG